MGQMRPGAAATPVLHRYSPVLHQTTAEQSAGAQPRFGISPGWLASSPRAPAVACDIAEPSLPQAERRLISAVPIRNGRAESHSGPFQPAITDNELVLVGPGWWPQFDANDRGSGASPGFFLGSTGWLKRHRVVKQASLMSHR